jgi:hypothetical protein
VSAAQRDRSPCLAISDDRDKFLLVKRVDPNNIFKTKQPAKKEKRPSRMAAAQVLGRKRPRRASSAKAVLRIDKMFTGSPKVKPWPAAFFGNVTLKNAPFALALRGIRPITNLK